MRQGTIGVLFLLTLLVRAVTPSHAMGSAVSAASVISRAPSRTMLARLKPSAGTYFGVNLQWGEDTAAAYTQRLGQAPMVYVNFFRFPFEQSDLQHLQR